MFCSFCTCCNCCFSHWKLDNFFLILRWCVGMSAWSFVRACVCVCVCVYMSACERHIKVWTHVADTSFNASLWLGSLILCLSIEKRKGKKTPTLKQTTKPTLLCHKTCFAFHRLQIVGGGGGVALLSGLLVLFSYHLCNVEMMNVYECVCVCGGFYFFFWLFVLSCDHCIQNG